MIDTTPLPTRWLKTGAALARWALWLVASVWIVVAIVWGVLHFLIVPRIAEFRPALEQYASRALGVTVRVGAIAAQSNGLIPAFELSQVTLHDAQDREVLRLPTVQVALSPRSVMGRGFEQLYIDSPVLDAHRGPDGRIWVAGLAVPTEEQQDSAAMDWIFSQAELVIRNGTVRWSDATRTAAPVALTDVDLVLRNGLLSHALQLDATPPPEWGQRLSLLGVFKQPLLSRHAGQWKRWKGQLYADFAQADLAQLRPYVPLGIDVAQGTGALRAWVEVNQGEVTGVTADVALHHVNVRVSPQLDALTLARVSGRLGAQMRSGGYELSTQALQFDTQDGLHWPGGNLRVGIYAATAQGAARGEWAADRLDLAAMAEIGSRLPLGEATHGLLKQLAPKGLVEQVQGSWAGPLEQAHSVMAKGRVVGLELLAANHQGAALPGVKGADIDFDITTGGGRANIAINHGALDTNGVFEDPVVPVDQLTGEVQWKTEGTDISVTVSKLRFANADAQGELQAKWHTAESPADGRFPGVLDLQGSLSRAQGTQVHRYLPLELDQELRHYLRDAIAGGTGSNVRFKVKGNLKDFPFIDDPKSDFRISADVKNARFTFAPPRILDKDSLPWPTLTELSGELVIDHDTLQVKGARGGLSTAPGVQVTKAEATISKLYHSTAALVVSAQASGPLADALQLVNASPLGGLTQHALAQAHASGLADYRIKLGIPLFDLERTTVQGSVALAGNDLQISADTPRLSRTRGLITFNETGFLVAGGQAQALGGEVRLEGGLSNIHFGTSATVLRLQGTASAEGLRQATELGFVARLAPYASGATAYTAVLGLRSGITELQVNSSLVGLGLGLPAPFAKVPEAAVPLRLEVSAVRAPALVGMPSVVGVVAGQDQWQLDIGKLASLVYVRDVSGPTARVLRGAIGVGLAGDESAPLPAKGVVANIHIDSADLDAWSQVLSGVSGVSSTASTPSTSGIPGHQTADLATRPAALEAQTDSSLAYLPTSLAVRARELTLGGRKLTHVVVGGGREDLLWRANLDATELSGYVEYLQPAGTHAGRLYGRLARLAIGPSNATEVENLLDQQPTSIPALDVVVEDFELRGKKLGRLEIDAVNLSAQSGAALSAGAGAGVSGPRDTGAAGAREWRLNRINLIMPEAVFTATGNWTDINAQATPGATRNIRERRRTVMNFKLDLTDSGELLNRLGMTGVIRKGNGKLEGQVAWLGSPLTLDYPSLAGKFNVNVEVGQFLKTEPGLAKLLGVLSLQSLPRRLALDFRDVFSEGFAFDFVRGDVTIEQGIAHTNNLQMKGVSAAVLMEGQADIGKETQAIKVVVVPEINAGSASLIASVINPVVGLTTFLAQVILRRPLIESATQEFFVDGTWLEPRVTKVERGTPPLFKKSPAPAQ